MSFVYDNSSLNGSKVNRAPLPGGEDPNKWIQADEDWNPTISAIYDLRTAIISNEFLGVARQALVPDVPVDGADDFLWADASGDIYWHKDGVGDQKLNNATVTVSMQDAYDGGRTIETADLVSPIEISTASTGHFIAFKDDGGNTLALAKNWGPGGGGATVSRFGLFEATGTNGVWFDDVRTEIWGPNSLVGMYAAHSEYSLFSSSNLLYMDANESSFYGPGTTSGFRALAATVILHAASATRVTVSATAMTATVSGSFTAPSAGVGSVLNAKTSGAVTLFDVTDNSSHTLRSAMADGASAIALIVDTGVTWSDTGAKLLSLRTNGSEVLYVGQPALATFWELRSTNTFIGLRNNTTTGWTAQGSSGYFYVSASAFHEFTSSAYKPFSDLGITIGEASKRVGAVHQGTANVGTAQTVGITLSNTTAALVGAQQYSPALTLLGKTWETTGGTSQTSGWLVQAQGFNATVASSYLNFYHNRNGTLDAAFRLEYSTGGATIFRNPVGNSLWYSTNGNAQIQIANGLIYFGVGSTYFDIAAGYMRPETDINSTFGDSTHRLTELWAPKLRNTSTVTAQTDLTGSGGASDIAFRISTGTNNWTTNNAKFFQITSNNDTVNRFSIASYDSGSGVIFNTASTGSLILSSGGTFLGSATTSFTTSWNISNGFEWVISTAQTYRMDSTSFENSTDVAKTLGNTTRRWGGVYSKFYDTKMGAQLTAAATITPTTAFHHVTGATTIDTIAVTNLGTGNPMLYLVGDTLIDISAAGNVLTACTIPAGFGRWFKYDVAATKWVPHA